MPYVDLSFRLSGAGLPVDHGYALYSAISRHIPEVHDAKEIGIHPVRGLSAAIHQGQKKNDMVRYDATKGCAKEGVKYEL